jgi:formylglycine-generating enzyme required for sulfatase activity
MIVIPGPVEFWRGSPPTEANHRHDELQYKTRIGRTFALAAKQVTVEQYRKFDKGYSPPAIYTRTADLPVVGIDWFQAARYCNWLSKEEGIPEDQWCYEIKDNRVRLPANHLNRGGYRLPREAELEYASRAGAVTSRCYGETDELLAKYAWYNKNSRERTWPVGSLKPNDLGLFDVHGNVWTWCQDIYRAQAQGGETGDDKEDAASIDRTTILVFRGGSFFSAAPNVRSAGRFDSGATNRSNDLGFRLARTFVP